MEATTAWAEPAGQSWQKDEAALELNVPVGQLLHLSAASREKVPALQVAQVVEADVEANEPAPHSAQTVAPVLDACVPMGQLLHDFWAEPDTKYPAVHATQVVEPYASETNPVEQDWHVVERVVLLKDPDSQAGQDA